MLNQATTEARPSRDSGQMMIPVRPTQIPEFDLASYAKEVEDMPLMPPPNSDLVLDRRPTVSQVEAHDIDLDHLTLFLLMHVDGVSTVREILQFSGVSGEIGLQIFEDLSAREIIQMDGSDLESRRSTRPPPWGKPVSFIRA